MDNENKYAAELQRAQQENREQQRANKQQQETQEASEDPDWQPGSGDESKKYKISAVVGLLMIITALIIDGIEFVFASFVITEPINWIVWIYAVLGFYVWLKMIGISWTDAKGKRTMMMFGGATGIEFIPYVNMLPAWTAFVVGAIINDRIEGIIKRFSVGAKSSWGDGKKKEQ